MPRLKKEIPDWLPSDLSEKYNDTDLDYSYCLLKFAELQAAKRDTIPKETMRVWFNEFIRRRWTKKMFDERFRAVLCSEMFGAVTINNWLNAVEVYAMDEVRIMIKRKVDFLIERGKMLKNKKIELTDEDKKAVDLAIAKEIEFEKQRELYAKLDDYKTTRRKLFSSKEHKNIEG